MNIWIGPTGKMFHATFPFNKKVLENFRKTYSETTWDAQQKVWTFPVNGRNFNRVMMSNGLNPFNYDKPIELFAVLGFLPHQNNIYSFILTRKQCIIAGQMRTMKTRPTLKAVEDFISTQPIKKVWYVAPKSAVRGVKREYNKWFGIKWDGNKALGLPYELTLINYEKWSRILDEEGIEALVPPCVIFDEVHRLKSESSNVGELARSVYWAQKKKYNDNFLLVGLSGTPAPKNPSDWWNQLEVVAPGFTPWSSVHHMQMDLAYCIQSENDSGQKYWTVEEWLTDKVNAFADTLVGKISLPVFKKDVLDIPDKVHEYVKLTPSRDTRDALAFLTETAVTKIELINKCRQISDGFLYGKEPDEASGKYNRTTDYTPTPKIEQLIEDLKDLRARGIDRVVVLAAYKASVDIVADICISQGWETMRADGRGFLPINSTHSSDFFLDEFDRSSRTSSSFLAIAGHPKSVATGLELSAAPVMIYWSHTNDGEAEFQSVERAHSINMDKELGLTIKHYVHLSVDREIIDSLVTKNTLQEITMGTILDRIREDL